MTEFTAVDSFTIPGMNTLYVIDGIPGFNPQTLFDKMIVVKLREQTIQGTVKRIEMYALKDNTGKSFSVELSKPIIT